MASERADKRKLQPKKELVIILDDLDFSWTEYEVYQAMLMWTAMYSIEEMAQKLRPYDSKGNAIDEVTLLIMHLSRQGKIKRRQGGVLGNGQ